MSSCEKMQFKKLWHQKFSCSARLAQTFSGFGSTKIRLGFGSNVFRLNFCGFGSGAQVYKQVSRIYRLAQCNVIESEAFPPILFVFLIILVHHHHPAFLRHQALFLDRLLTFLVAFSTLLLKPAFSQSLSLCGHQSLAEAHLLELNHSLMAVAVLTSTADKAAQLAFGRTVIGLYV